MHKTKSAQHEIQTAETSKSPAPIRLGPEEEPSQATTYYAKEYRSNKSEILIGALLHGNGPMVQLDSEPALTFAQPFQFPDLLERKTHFHGHAKIGQ
jgi:hypothetical protein